MNHSALQKLTSYTALLLTVVCLSLPFIATATAIRGISVPVQTTREDAVREGASMALERYLRSKKLTASQEQKREILDSFQPYFTRYQIVRDATLDGQRMLFIDYTLAPDEIGQLLVHGQMETLVKQMKSPQIAVAIVPRAPQDTTLEKADKQFFIETLNAEIKALFAEHNIAVVSPDWLFEELADLSGDPDHITHFQKNAMVQARFDPEVDYLITGTATFDLKRAPNGHEVMLSIVGDALNTYEHSGRLTPLRPENSSIRGEQVRQTMGAAASLVADMLGKQTINNLVRDWSTAQRDGKKVTIELFYDSPDFRYFILDALEAHGSVLRESAMLEDKLSVLYQSPRLTDLRHRRLSRAFDKWVKESGEYDSVPPFLAEVSPSRIIIAPDTPKYREVMAAIIENRPQDLIDLESLPVPLREQKIADKPVHPEPATSLAMVARRYEQCVGIVLVQSSKYTGSGTVWAVGPNLMATNAHVAVPVADALKEGSGKAAVIMNKSNGKLIRITGVFVDKRYRDESAAYDVALFVVDHTFDTYFQLADTEMLKALEIGEPVALIGFPYGPKITDVSSPSAVMQDGIVIGLNDWNGGHADFSNRLLVRHNIASYGGASGSPIFNGNGAVVAVHNARHYDKDGDKSNIGRINYAQRIDLLQALLDAYNTSKQ